MLRFLVLLSGIRCAINSHVSSIRILVIEDDPDGRQSVVDAIRDAGYEVAVAAAGRAGVTAFRESPADVVLTDLVLPDIDGIEVLGQVRKISAHAPVLIMTAYGSVDTAVRALKAGAYDYVVKPLDLDDLQAKIRRAAEASRLRREVSTLHDEIRGRHSARAMVAAAPAMQPVLAQIESVAGTNATVLIQGESGTGKELVARALHADGRRSAGPFVAVNCGAFTESLLASELFGHEKGSFTGAVARHAGAFERADGGTLFLDEIGIAPLAVQARLLRALEDREITRVGGQVPVRADVRIVAASNRELDDLVAEGEFRSDLLYRLRVVTIRLPPLRERREDIRALVDRFVAAACAAHGRHVERAAPDYYEALERHDWPGNIRELRNVVESSVIMARGVALTAADINLGRAPMAPVADAPALAIPPAVTLAELEKQALLQSLRRHEGNRVLVAQELGISTRTIQRKIKDYGLPF